MTEPEMKTLQYGMVLRDPMDGEVVMLIAGREPLGYWEVWVFKRPGGVALRQTERSISTRWEIVPLP